MNHNRFFYVANSGPLLLADNNCAFVPAIDQIVWIRARPWRVLARHAGPDADAPSLHVFVEATDDPHGSSCPVGAPAPA